MTRKDLKDNILNHRMNFLINYYISQEKFNAIHKYKLIQTYIYSYKDNYLNNENKNKTKNETKNETDDVSQTKKSTQPIDSLEKGEHKKEIN